MNPVWVWFTAKMSQPELEFKMIESQEFYPRCLPLERKLLYGGHILTVQLGNPK